MTKKVSDSDQITVSWNKVGERRIFFLGHKSFEKPIPCYPEYLGEEMVRITNEIDKNLKK